MTLREKILALENRIIDWLTILTWWTEVRFNRSNLSLAVAVNIVSMLLFFSACARAGAWFYKAGYAEASVLLFLPAFAFLFVAFFWTIKADFFLSGMTKIFPQGCPNPSRDLKTTSGYRVIAVVLTFFFSILFAITHMYPFFLASLGYLMNTFFCYLLSCDSIPPEEKVKRRARNEMKNIAV